MSKAIPREQKNISEGNLRQNQRRNAPCWIIPAEHDSVTSTIPEYSDSWRGAREKIIKKKRNQKSFRPKKKFSPKNDFFSSLKKSKNMSRMHF